MRIEDLSEFHSVVKDTITDWCNGKIDELLPKSPVSKTLLKNGLKNVLARYEATLNKWADNLFLLVADGDGVIDSDTMIDTMADVFSEIPPREYHAGGITANVGKGSVVVELPRNILVDMLVGGTGSIRLTADDILELKDIIN